MYAVHYNHKKERHLNGGVLDSAFSRPAILITDADNAMQEPVGSRDTLDNKLREAIMATVRQNGAPTSLLPLTTVFCSHEKDV